MGRATATRLAYDFSSIAVVARDSASLEETASAVRTDRSRGALHFTRSQSSLGGGGCDGSNTGGVWSTRRACSHRSRRSSRPLRPHRRYVGRRYGAEISQRTSLAITASPHLVTSERCVVSTSGTSVELPKAFLAAAGTFGAAIVTLAKRLADRGLKDCVRLNSISKCILTRPWKRSPRKPASCATVGRKPLRRRLDFFFLHARPE